MCAGGIARFDNFSEIDYTLNIDLVRATGSSNSNVIQQKGLFKLRIRIGNEFYFETKKSSII